MHGSYFEITRAFQWAPSWYVPFYWEGFFWHQLKFQVNWVFEYFAWVLRKFGLSFEKIWSSFEKIWLSFQKICLSYWEFSPEFQEYIAFIEYFTKIVIFYSRKLLKVTFVVHMVVNFVKLAINVLENFRFFEFFFFFFWKYPLIFKEKLVEFEFFSPWVLGWTTKKACHSSKSLRGDKFCQVGAHSKALDIETTDFI